MRDPLVDELRELATWLDVPEPAQQTAAVRARLAAAPATASRPTAAGPDVTGGARYRWPGVVRRLRPRRPRSRRWVAVVAAALVAVVVGVVPPARAAVTDAVGRVLRFAGVEIRDEGAGPTRLPATPSPLPSVRSAALDEARRLAKFPVKAPVVLGVPEDVQVADPAPDGAPRVVSLVYRGGTVRVDQFDGRVEGHFLKRAPGAEYVTVRGEFAVWLPGPHPLVYVDRFGVEHTETGRLAGPTLIWFDAGGTYRLEGVPDLAEAMAIAESMT